MYFLDFSEKFSLLSVSLFAVCFYKMFSQKISTLAPPFSTHFIHCAVHRAICVTREVQLGSCHVSKEANKGLPGVECVEEAQP